MEYEGWKLATGERYNVYATRQGRRNVIRKLIAKRVGAFRASKLSKEIKARGFGVEIVEIKAVK